MTARRRCTRAAASVVVAGLMAAGAAQRTAGSAGETGAPNRIAAAYGKLPLRFERNEGQFDPRVRFASSGPGYTVFLTDGEAVLTLGKATTLRMGLAGASPRTRVTGLDRLTTTSNYFMGGDRSKWRRGVANFARVRYDAVYPGIDLVYYGSTQQQLEYDFEVAPGADPSRIAIDVDGAEGLSVAANGDLVMRTKAEPVRLHRPAMYQEIDGARRPVNGGFRLTRSNHLGFTVGVYDRTKPLVIDPILEYSTFLGGSILTGNGGEALGIAVDAAGSAYLTGWATYADFPGTAGAFNVRNAETSGFSATDVFVAKLDPTGSSLVYSAYFGGFSADIPHGIAIDAQGSAYVVGTTSSAQDINYKDDFRFVFPSTTFAYASYDYYLCGFSGTNASTNAFVTKLDAGGALVYSEMIGAYRFCTGGSAIAVDAAGNAYITGITSADDNPDTPEYEGLPGAQRWLSRSDPDPNRHGGAYVMKLDPGGAIAYSRYLGGSEQDFGWGIAVDGGGNAYVAGLTFSPDFPTTADAYQPVMGGNANHFLTKLGPGGGILYSTFIGGTYNAEGAPERVALDGAGNIYVSGQTGAADFPTTAGAVPPVGARYGFVMKFDPTFALQYSAVLGATISGIAADGSGNLLISGDGCSSANVPIVNPIMAPQGYWDGLVAKLNPDGSAFVYTTCLGGGLYDRISAIAVDRAGSAYVAGFGESGGYTDFPTTPGAFQHANPANFLLGVSATPVAAKISEPPSSGGARCAAKPDGLVAWWRGEGDASDSVGSRAGTLLGGTTFEPGRVGRAFRFHFSYADGVQLPQISVGDRFTISFWMKSTYGYGPLLTNSINGGQHFGVLQQEFNTIGYHDVVGGSLGSIGGNTAAVPLSDWAFVTLASDGSRVRLYLNGNQQLTSLPVTQILDNPLRIGKAADDYGLYSFDGLIDEVAIFNRALSVKEIFSIYDAGGAGMCSRPPDTNPPTLSGGSGNVTSEASGGGGAIVTYVAPSATDDVDGSVPVTCDKPSGGAFPLGANVVTCSAVDAAGNSASTSFTITVVDTTPPVIIGTPASFAAEATSGAGVAVTYTSPSASDVVDGAVFAHCSPASGSTFGLGANPVSCAAIDAHGNTAHSSFTITVTDHTAPVISGTPASFSVEATSASGVVATYASPTASDLVDGAVTVACGPASGSTFAVGGHPVTCTATDAHGNAAHSSFTVTVTDHSAPVISGTPANFSVEATSGAGAVVTYALPTAADVVDGGVPIACSPASGATLSLGPHLVTCSAADHAGNGATSSFTVTVRDTTAPKLTVPANITTPQTGAAGAAVSFTASGSDLVDGVVTVTCAPASGSTFAVGTTTVACNTTDRAGNVARASFTVTVTAIGPTPESLFDELKAAIDRLAPKLDDDVLRAARALDRDRIRKSCSDLDKLEKTIAKQKKLTAAEISGLIGLVDRLELAIGCQ